MAVKIQLRRGTALEWFTANPVLAIGEMCVETDTPEGKFKVGNGVSTWNSLPYSVTIGPQGLTGSQGIQGIQGIQGVTGLSGANGTNGANGSNGIDGADGVNGVDGADGSDGDSAYQIAFNNGFVGSETIWLESLIGATGATGANGANGANGTNGTDGIDGIDGVDGASYQESFETVSKNLKTYPFTLAKTGSVLNSITYTLPVGTIVKTFAYGVDGLSSITLSGSLPLGIQTVKTLNYVTGVFSSVTYS